MTVQRDYLESSFREKMLEHIFVSEMLLEVWFHRNLSVNVLRSEVDNSGYDLVLEYEGVSRYIQLKSSKLTASTSSITVNDKLATKLGSCVVWIFYDSEKATSLRHRYFGGTPQDHLNFQHCQEVAGKAKHKINIGQFCPRMGAPELFDKLSPQIRLVDQ